MQLEQLPHLLVVRILQFAVAASSVDRGEDCAMAPPGERLLHRHPHHSASRTHFTAQAKPPLPAAFPGSTARPFALPPRTGPRRPKSVPTAVLLCAVSRRIRAAALAALTSFDALSLLPLPLLLRVSLGVGIADAGAVMLLAHSSTANASVLSSRPWATRALVVEFPALTIKSLRVYVCPEHKGRAPKPRPDTARESIRPRISATESEEWIAAGELWNRLGTLVGPSLEVLQTRMAGPVGDKGWTVAAAVGEENLQGGDGRRLAAAASAMRRHVRMYEEENGDMMIFHPEGADAGVTGGDVQGEETQDEWIELERIMYGDDEDVQSVGAAGRIAAISVLAAHAPRLRVLRQEAHALDLTTLAQTCPALEMLHIRNVGLCSGIRGITQFVRLRHLAVGVGNWEDGYAGAGAGGGVEGAGAFSVGRGVGVGMRGVAWGGGGGEDVGDVVERLVMGIGRWVRSGVVSLAVGEAVSVETVKRLFCGGVRRRKGLESEKDMMTVSDDEGGVASGERMEEDEEEEEEEREEEDDLFGAAMRSSATVQQQQQQQQSPFSILANTHAAAERVLKQGPPTGIYSRVPTFMSLRKLWLRVSHPRCSLPLIADLLTTCPALQQLDVSFDASATRADEFVEFVYGLEVWKRVGKGKRARRQQQQYQQQRQGKRRNVLSWDDDDEEDEEEVESLEPGREEAGKENNAMGATSGYLNTRLVLNLWMVERHFTEMRVGNVEREIRSFSVVESSGEGVYIRMMLANSTGGFLAKKSSKYGGHRDTPTKQHSQSLSRRASMVLKNGQHFDDDVADGYAGTTTTGDETTGGEVLYAVDNNNSNALALEDALRGIDVAKMGFSQEVNEKIVHVLCDFE
ncbi:hypothetical protein HDU98_011985, partial [Podochytrium sp. JEL0797]